jgi:signal transduction histidine kinase
LDKYRLYKDIYGPYVIIVGRDLDALITAQNALLSVLLLTLLCTLGLTAGLSAMFAGRALRPLTRFSKRVRDIDPRHLPVPALAGHMPDDEIGHLAQTFDDFLRRLEYAFKRERQFTQDASHELRTPLMVIKSSLELLSVNRTLTDTQKEKMSLMQGAVNRMEVLVAELLVLSRGMQAGKREQIQIANFVKELEPTFRAMAEDKGLLFTIKIAKHVATISAHRIALEKVIGNLLKNAVRFTQTGSIHVDVTGNVITITDTGIGIAEKDIPHIFERFYRGDLSRQTEGTGLGLAICKDICDEEGWTIRVESTPGEGSTFRLGF